MYFFFKVGILLFSCAHVFFIIYNENVGLQIKDTSIVRTLLSRVSTIQRNWQYYIEPETQYGMLLLLSVQWSMWSRPIWSAWLACSPLIRFDL